MLSDFNQSCHDISRSASPNNHTRLSAAQMSHASPSFSSKRCNSSLTSVDVIAVPTASYSHPCCAQTGPLLPISNAGCRVLYIMYFFVSLLSLCHLCFCLMQRPFSVHAQLRHAVTHHSACFLQQPFTASLLFSPSTISSCISQTTMCFSVTNTPFTFTFRLCFLFNQAPLGLRPCPWFLSAFQPHSLFHRAFSQSTALMTFTIASFPLSTVQMLLHC